MSRVRTRLEQYKAEIEKKSQYKHGLPGSALDIVNTLLNDLEQDEKENGWIPVKYHQISEKERAEESISKNIQYMLDCKMPDDGQQKHKEYSSRLHRKRSWHTNSTYTGK